jgi:hypothetical protein
MHSSAPLRLTPSPLLSGIFSSRIVVSFFRAHPRVKKEDSSKTAFIPARADFFAGSGL